MKIVDVVRFENYVIEWSSWERTPWYLRFKGREYRRIIKTWNVASSGHQNPTERSNEYR